MFVLYSVILFMVINLRFTDFLENRTHKRTPRQMKESEISRRVRPVNYVMSHGSNRIDDNKQFYSYNKFVAVNWGGLENVTNQMHNFDSDHDANERWIKDREQQV